MLVDGSDQAEHQTEARTLKLILLVSILQQGFWSSCNFENYEQIQDSLVELLPLMPPLVGWQVDSRGESPTDILVLSKPRRLRSGDYK
jgi:hypothetical protein